MVNIQPNSAYIITDATDKLRANMQQWCTDVSGTQVASQNSSNFTFIQHTEQ